MATIGSSSSSDPLIGFAEIAELAGVKVQTTWEWKKRGILPPVNPEHVIPPNRARWPTSVIAAWLVATGRVKSD